MRRRSAAALVGRASRAGLSAVLLGALLAAPARAQEEGAGAEAPAPLVMGGLLLFMNARAPMSLVTMPAKPKGAQDLGEVKGDSCQHGLSVPLTASFRATSLSGSAGNGGFDKALSVIRKEHPGLTGIYDVRVDLRELSILGIYRKLCVEVVARGFK